MNSFDSPEMDLNLKEPESFGNLADPKRLDESANHALAEFVQEVVKIDETSMTDWVGAAKGYIAKIAATENVNAPESSSDGKGTNEDGPPSTAVTMSAVIQFTARVTGAILSEPDLVKASEPGGEKLAGWMSSQLRTVDPDWVSDTDPLTMHMAITGLAWRKRWYDDHDQNFRSTWVPSVDGDKAGIIINANTKTLERAPRITHPIQKYPYEIKRSIELGHWIDYAPRFDDIDPQELKDFYEIDMWLDLDGDGQEEPWTITVALDDTPTVVKIVPRWSKKSVTDTKEVLVFRPVRRYYAYRMIPNPTGKFLPLGFGWLLSRIEASADRMLASIDDTAKAASENGGVAATGGLGLPDVITLQGNQLSTINADGRKIDELVSFFPPKQVSPGSVQILDKILTLADRLAGTLNLLENAPASMTATMAKGIIDSGSQVQGAVHRRIIGEMTEEMRSFGRAADDMDQLPEGIKGSGPIAVSADPQMATEMHRAAVAQVYQGMLQMPMIFDPQECARRFAETMRLPNPEKLVKLMSKPQPTDQERAEFALKNDDNAIKRMTANANGVLKIAQAIQALSTAGVNAANADLVAIEVAKLKTAVSELSQDAPTSQTPIDNGATGGTSGTGDPAGVGAGAPGPNGAAVPVGGGGGPGPTGAGDGAGPASPPAAVAA